MRGITRLANATQSLLKQADAEADAAAQEVEDAVKQQLDVSQKYRAFAADAKAKAAEALDTLNQLSNDPTGTGA